MCFGLLFSSWLTRIEGEFDDVIVVEFISPRGSLPRVFGLPPELQCFRPPFFVNLSHSFWVVDAFQDCCLGLQSLCSGLGFGRGRGFLLRLWHHLCEKRNLFLVWFLSSHLFCHFYGVGGSKRGNTDAKGSGLYFEPCMIFPIALITWGVHRSF